MSCYAQTRVLLECIILHVFFMQKVLSGIRKRCNKTYPHSHCSKTNQNLISDLQIQTDLNLDIFRSKWI